MTLTEALAALGGAVFLGVLVHGAWSAHRAASRARAALAAVTPSDASLGAQSGPARAPGAQARGAARVEPTLGDATLDHVPWPSPSGLGSGASGGEPGLGEASLAEAAALPGSNAEVGRKAVRLDALIDLIATLNLDHPCSGEQALQHLPTSRRAGNKWVLIEGWSATGEEWEPLRGGERYTMIQAGVQMANRHGALNEIEYSEFVQSLQAYADAIGATADFPDMLEGVARARELDHFASEHDAQLAAVLRANSVAWSVGFVHQAAARQGFVPGHVPGRLVLPPAEVGAPPLLVLSFDARAALAEDPGQASLREITLSLDVPQTAEAVEPFALWQERGRRLAEDLDATLVDDRGQPITLHAYALIGQELARVYGALEARDLAAGSPLARRLFS